MASPEEPRRARQKRPRRLRLRLEEVRVVPLPETAHTAYARAWSLLLVDGAGGAAGAGRASKAKKEGPR
jgi:hypothetical protein